MVESFKYKFLFFVYLGWNFKKMIQLPSIKNIVGKSHQFNLFFKNALSLNKSVLFFF